MAPEVLRDTSSSRTVKYDVYSFGILLWEILSEQMPFENGKILPTLPNLFAVTTCYDTFVG